MPIPREGSLWLRFKRGLTWATLDEVCSDRSIVWHKRFFRWLWL